MKKNDKVLSGYTSVKGTEEKFGRSGKCDFKKCKAACCKFGVVGYIFDDEEEKYWKSMGFKIETMNGKRAIIHNHPCKQLDLKTLKCKIQKTKSVACKQFLMPTDAVYTRIAKKCSYIFKEGKEVKMR